MADKMDLLKKKILSTVSVGADSLDLILSSFSKQELDKNHCLLKRGSVCNSYFFLEEGALRFVFEKEEKEETSWVVFQDTFFTEIVSMRTKEPTLFSVEALAPSLVYAIDENTLNTLCEKIPVFERFLRLTWEDNLCHVIQMKIMQQFSDAKSVYEFLLGNKQFMQQVPQKYLASILGITPSSLSRIRKAGKS